MKFLNNTATLLSIATLAISSLTTKNPASAADVTLTTSKPLSDGIVNIQFTFNNITSTVLVNNIRATDTEEIKRAKIALELIANGFDIETSSQTITVKNLCSGTQVLFSSLSTGEGQEELEALNIYIKRI